MLQTEDFRSDEAAGVRGSRAWHGSGDISGMEEKSMRGKLLKHLRGQHVGRNADMEVTKNNAGSDGDKTGSQAWKDSANQQI